MWVSGGRGLVLLMAVVSIVVGGAGNLHRPFNHSISTVLIFGDSTVDPGNNNYVETPFRSNFPPYGRDFADHIPTGRFTNGRLVTDFIAAYIGIKEYVPPYLKPMLSLQELMSGVSFASAGSGLDPLTARILNVIPLEKQVEHFKEYKLRLEEAIGKEGTKSLLSKAAILISAGVNDVIITYNITQFRRKNFDLESYLQFLLRNAEKFIQFIVEEGAAAVGVVGMPPLGCLPAIITLTSGVVGSRPCSDFLSSIALDYNNKLQKLVANVRNTVSGRAIIVYADIYKPLNDLIHNPSHIGIEVVNIGCCGSGLLEASFLCNPTSLVCENPSKYVFFDSIHPTQAAYYYIFQTLRPLIDTVLKKYANSSGTEPEKTIGS